VIGEGERVVTEEQAAETAAPAQERGAAVRAALRWLYVPYVLLVYVPFLAATTIFWGIAAVLTSLVSRRVGFHCGTVWAWCLCRANFTWVRIRGREHARPGQSYVIMSNHQSHFDVLAFYGHWGHQFRWIMKQELRKVPGLGWGCAAVGHIFVDRSNRERAIASMHAAAQRLEPGVSVMIFPEGTRSPDGRMRAFKKGGFMMALEMGLPILPVTISGSRHVLPGHTMRLLPGSVRIQVHEPIPVAGLAVEDRERLMDEVAAVIRSGLSPWEQGPAS
jgi:1-acyl-sn-glycerol-3-phosphate acyltransferase